MSDTPKWTPGPWRVWNEQVMAGKGMALVAVVYTGLSDSRAENVALIAAAPELYEACAFVKSYLTRLEAGTPPDDPLREIRRTFHRPLHDVLDSAMAKARGEKP